MRFTNVIDGGSQEYLLKSINCRNKIIIISPCLRDSIVVTSLCTNSIQLRTASCSGVSEPSAIVDIIYCVESLCIGIDIAFVKTVHSCIKSDDPKLRIIK